PLTPPPGAPPFRRGGQAHAAPVAVDASPPPGGVHNGVARPVITPRPRPLRVLPARALHLPPPGRARHTAGIPEIIRKQTRKDERPAESLGVRSVSGGLSEPPEAAVRHREGIHPEGSQGD